MKVALVHDFLVEYGGGERVLEALHQIFPEAPIYTAYVDLSGMGPHKDRLKNWDIRSSAVQKIPFAKRFISPFRIFAPKIFESFNLSEYDLIISSCNSYFAKAVRTTPRQLHLSYIHTPPRYLYGYATSFNYKKHWWTRIGGEVANHFLRLTDFETSQRPDVLIANSKEVQRRIKKFYRRDSVLIYPPVNLEEFREVKKAKGKYFLSLNRLVRGKGTEVVVVACSQLNLPLKVAGSGPELKRLQGLAKKSVEFLGEVTDKERVELLAGAKAVIVASEDEDFGITAVEAQAAGTPVIAVRAGGYLETIEEGETGAFFNEPTTPSLMGILETFDESKFKAENCRQNAEKFSQEKFKKEILDLIGENLRG